MTFSRQDQSQQQLPAPSSAQLVVRNKRGRKVDETLPKSHQREVQRQFRARRTSHLLELEQRVALLERENLILRHYAGFQASNRPLLGRGPTGCDTTKPLLADENDPAVYLVRIEGWTAPPNHSPLTATAHDPQWSITPPTASSLHPRPDYSIDPHSDHPYATYDGPKSPDKLVFEPFEPLPTKIEHQPHPIPSYESAHPTHFEPVQSPYDTAPPARFDCLPPLAPESVSKQQRDTYSTPMSSLLSNPSGTRHPLNHGLYPSDTRTTPFTVNPQHDSTAVPPTPYQTGASVPPNLSVYSWSAAASNSDSYGRSHAPSLSSVNLPTNPNGPGTTDHRHHHFQGSSIPNYPPYRPAPLNSFTPAAAGAHPSFQPVDTPTESTFNTT